VLEGLDRKYTAAPEAAATTMIIITIEARNFLFHLGFFASEVMTSPSGWLLSDM
jgi:hypothetical protein